jgi:signal transduction histidine kinase
MREFTADDSHQLQTPLTVMKGTIESARKGTSEDHAQALSAVSDEVNALTATLQDLRDLALADADSAGSRVGPVIVSEVFEEAGELVSALAEAHGVTCETAIEPGLRVWGNPVRLRQLLLNLGENAVEFTPAGGSIRIEAAGRDGIIVAKVSDTGAGISAELLPRVFDRHVHGQAQGAKARSGLGLAIVKRIVDAHGGTVVIQSQAGVGTTALITLPAAVPSA